MLSYIQQLKCSNQSLARIADEDKKLNATYIISVARKLGCSIFLLPEDIIEVRSSVLNVNLIVTLPVLYEKSAFMISVW